MRISDWSSDVCSSDLGQYGDCPQAQTLLSGLEGVGHVIADAACDADPLRAFIVDDLGATAPIKANPGRAIAPPIDWRLYTDRPTVACFLNKPKSFRRNALLCETTTLPSIGFGHIPQ